MGHLDHRAATGDDADEAALGVSGFDRVRAGVVDGLLHILAGMLRAANVRYADVLGLDVPGRLAKWLLVRADVNGERS